MEYAAIALASVLDPIKIIISSIIALSLFHRRNGLALVFIVVSFIYVYVGMAISINQDNQQIIVHISSFLALTVLFLLINYRFGSFPLIGSSAAFSLFGMVLMYVVVQGSVNSAPMTAQEVSTVLDNRQGEGAAFGNRGRKPEVYMHGAEFHDSTAAERTSSPGGRPYQYAPLLDMDVQPSGAADGSFNTAR